MTTHLICTVNVSGLTPSSHNQTSAGWHLKTYAVCKTLLIMAELVRQMKKDHKRSTMYAIAFKLDRPHKVKGRASDTSSNQTIYSHKRVSSQRMQRCLQWASALQSLKHGCRDGAHAIEPGNTQWKETWLLQEDIWPPHTRMRTCACTLVCFPLLWWALCPKAHSVPYIIIWAIVHNRQKSEQKLQQAGNAKKTRWRNAAYCPVPAFCSHGFPTEPSNTCIRNGAASSRPCPPVSVTNQENAL